MNKETLIEKIEYLYPQICSIEESTFRDSLQNAIYLAMRTSLEELQDLLKYAGHAPLYVERETLLYGLGS